MDEFYAALYWRYVSGHRTDRVLVTLITVALMLAIIRFHTSGQPL